MVNALGQPEGSKTKLKIFMDLVRVNVVQATPGNDPVFNLHLNKMLPTPSLTVVTMRQVVISLSFKSSSLELDHFLAYCNGWRVYHAPYLCLFVVTPPLPRDEGTT